MSDESITNNKTEQNVERSSENREQGAATEKFQSEAQSALSSRDFTSKKDDTSGGALPKLELANAKDFGGKSDDTKEFGGKDNDTKGFGDKGGAKGFGGKGDFASGEKKGDKLDKKDTLSKDEMDKKDPLGKDEMDKKDPLGKDEMDKEDPLGNDEMDKEDRSGKDEMDKKDPLSKDEMDKKDPLGKDEMDKQDPSGKDDEKKGDYFDEKLDKWVDIPKDKADFDKKDFDKEDFETDKFDKVDPSKKAEIMDKIEAQSQGKPYYDKQLDKWVSPSKEHSQGPNYNRAERSTGITRASQNPNHVSDYSAGFTGPRKRHGGR